jgi:hypothetical protein
VQGLDTPASELIETLGAGLAGSIGEGITIGTRSVFLPIRIRGENFAELRALRAGLLAVTRLGQPVDLVVTVDDGDPRTITGYRVGDGSTSWQTDTFGVDGRQVLGLTLQCPDPWWRTDPVTFSWSYEGTGGAFFPLPPVSLAGSQVFGRRTVLNLLGNTDAYPAWELHGPFSAVTATDDLTGRTWTLTADVDTGEVVKVRTDPRLGRSEPLVLGPGGSSWISKVSPPYDLWPLGPESPSITISVTGATSDTKITATVTPLWEAAL